MSNILLILNIIVSVLLVVFILFQGKGAGLGSAWGGGGEMYQTRRGVEKIMMRLTIFLIICFLVISLVNLFVR
ncbi:MAG: preprotein translocase subunit SecG [Weeksellaceae bacterium]